MEIALECLKHLPKPLGRVSLRLLHTHGDP